MCGFSMPKSDMAQLSKAIGVGVASGGLSGLLGVGGGILMVPCLVFLLGTEQRRAHGTSLAAMVLISAAGLSGFILTNSVAYAPGLFIFVGSACGVVVGTWLLDRLEVRTLQVGLAVLMLITAARFLLLVADSEGHGGLTWLQALGYVACGLATGVLSGTMGVGGGIIMIPIMILFFGFEPTIAKGTSLLVIFPTSVIGTLRNRHLGNLCPSVAWVVGMAGVASAFVGALGANQLSPRLATSLFAGLLIVASVQMLHKGLQTR